MLKNRYQEVLVGLNLMSLMRGIVSLSRKRSTLLIGDHRFEADSFPANFLSEMEIKALLRLGTTYKIPELVDLRQFLSPGSLHFVMGETRLIIGKSPFANLREVLRKFPELVEKIELQAILAESPEVFNAFFLEEMKRFEQLCFESCFRPKGVRFDLQGPKWFKDIYKKFGEYINREYAVSKDLKFSALLHLLGVTAEEKLKTRLGPEEIPFYFFRLLSPVYRLHDFLLTTQLKRRLLLLGGDYKESSVQYWQLHEKKFENLLLASFEGVISGERVLFFSHFPDEVPFGIRSPYPLFRKSQMTPVKRMASPFPPTALTFIADPDLLGSLTPYRVLASENEMVSYQSPYPDLPGSKSEFYDRPLIESFEKDAQELPFEALPSTPQGILSVTLDLRQLREARRTEAPVLARLPMDIAEDDETIQGFEYWGPFRYRALGLLALCYGVEGV